MIERRRDSSSSHVKVTAGALVMCAAVVAPMVFCNHAVRASGATVKSPIPIGYSTTRITGPLGSDGLVDYIAAFNQRFGKGVTSQNNAAVPVLILFRPKSFEGGWNEIVSGKSVFVRDKNWGHQLRKALGISADELTGPHFIHYQEFRKRADPMAIARISGPGAPPKSPSYIPGSLYTKPWSARSAPWVAAWLQANEGALDLAQAAFLRSRFFVPMRSPSTHAAMMTAYNSVVSPLGMFQSLSEYLSLRAMLKLHRGNLKSCEANLLAAHRCGTLISQDHSLLTSMVGWATNTMPSLADISLANSGKLSARQDLAYIRSLNNIPQRVPLSSDFNTTERWMFLSMIEFVAINNHSNGLLIPGWKKAWSRVANVQAMVKFNHFQDQIVAAFKVRPFSARMIAIRKVQSTLLTKYGDLLGSYLKLTLQALPNTIGNEADSIALSRMDHVSFALAAYLKRRGTFPAHLSQLAPKYLPTIPLDPFTEKPFTYTSNPTGCTITSPGKFTPGKLNMRFFGRPVIVRLNMR